MTTTITYALTKNFVEGLVAALTHVITTGELKSKRTQETIKRERTNSKKAKRTFSSVRGNMDWMKRWNLVRNFASSKQI